jgi:MFS transporter, MHS family, proline/betaine transporter
MLSKSKKTIVASMIGNGLEWFDFALYGFVAVILSKLYFPSDGDSHVAMLKTYGVFAAGFVMRPLGAVIFGYIGDKYGRKVSLASSILLMALPTALIGILPTYADIGIWAPICLTIIRLLQGLALGGEFSGSIVYLVEHSKPEDKNLAGSHSITSTLAGMLLGLGVCTALTFALTAEQFETWGWRVPFILGFFVGLVGIYIRSQLDESPDFEAARKEAALSKTPVRELLLSKNFFTLLKAVGIFIGLTVPFYIFTIYLNGFLEKNVGYTKQQAMICNSIAMFVMLCICPLAAKLADKYGRKNVMMISIVTMIITVYPAFYFINSGDFAKAVIAESLFGGIYAFYLANVPAQLVSMFSVRLRYTGVGLACNLGAAIFGGTTPIMLTILLNKTGNNIMVATYLFFFASLAAIVLAFTKKTS